jgi:hypothetical protein
MSTGDKSELCSEVAERLAEILDGTASARLTDHLADCDTCRDARHEAEQARALVTAAGLDHRAPADLERRVLAALDKATEENEDEDDDEDDDVAEKPSAVAAPNQSRAPVAPDRAPSPGPLAAAGARAGWQRAWVKGGVFAAVAVAAVLTVVLRSSKQATDPRSAGSSWTGKLERVVSSTGSRTALACNANGQDCKPLAAGEALPAGGRIKTDGSTRAELRFADGSELALDRNTELTLGAGGERRVRLESGGLVADVTHAAKEARFELATGQVTVHGTKFSLRAQGKSATVDVARGSVTLADGSDRGVRVSEGETGVLEPGSPPVVAFSNALGEALGWSDETFGEEKSELVTTRGLGELRAKKPGQDGERTNAVTLASHRVRVRIAGAVARTEIEEVFENQTDEVLEGIYRFPLPPDAQIERLALDVDGKLEEGAFVDRDRAAAIWRGAIVNAAPKQRRPVEEIVWVPGPWRDPALLEWQRGGRFELRIFPIPKRGSRRVVLAYTEVVKATGGTRHYTYPLAYDPSGSTRVRSFGLDLEVRGHDAARGIRSVGYALDSAPSSEGVSALRFNAESFAPSGDLRVEYTLPGAQNELTAWTYFEGRGGATPLAGGTGAQLSDDVSPYVALALRPRLPRPEREKGRSVALVVDSSRSMLGEAYERATALAVRLVRELDESDRVTVLACGVDCRILPGGGLTPGAAAAAEARRFLQGIRPEDASDLVGSVERALGELKSDRGRTRRVIYLGDGAPTVGQVRPGSIERAIGRSIARVPAAVVSVAVGAEADQATLGALARGGDGVMLPYAPGRTTAEMAYAVLAASYGSALANVEVALPEGLRAVAPARLSSIPAGGEAFVLARMDNMETKGEVVLRGRVAGKPFEQRYPVSLQVTGTAGNAFVPRLYAAARLGDLEREGTEAAKSEAIALSTRFNVASRYTSLLVLESQAMMTAFGLKSADGTARFTGEDAAESTTAEGSEEVLGASEEDELAGGGSGRFASGIGAASPAAKKAEAAGSRATGAATDASNPYPAATTAISPPSPAKPAVNLYSDEPKEEKPRRRPSPAPLDPLSDVLEPTPQPGRRMVPMRRIWERRGEVFPDRRAPSSASASALEAAERSALEQENRREAVKKLFTLLLQAGDMERAGLVAERWSEKEPLDPEAITARGDVLAARGERSAARRVLGSVLDVRPGDVAGAKRLARFERWAGRPALGCRFSIAISEMRPADATLLAEAVRCARETFDTAAADELLTSASAATREAAERLLSGPRPDDQSLRGDLKLEATWQGGADLDLALIDPDGHRVSWLGAPTRGIITARDAVSTSGEALAFSGGKPGEYALEIVGSAQGGRSSGEVTVTVAGTTRRIPFTLDGNRARLGVAKIGMHSRLVPL